MKLHQVNRDNVQNASFDVKQNKHPHFLKLWHYHTELELVVINKSTGTRFIGDSIEKFQKGEIVLIGENLPHMWLNDEAYFESNSKLYAEATAVHFRKDFLGNSFFSVPEMKLINALIVRASHGILFTENVEAIIKKIQALPNHNSFKRMLKFIEILQLLAEQKNYKLLSSSGFVQNFRKSEDKAMYKIYEYIFNHFNQSISLESVAQVANMNSSSFSRYFKRVNRKTFSKYLNEIRVGYACKLLLEYKYNITQICYESGFNNISNFNRQFKLITGKSPSEYLNKHQS